MPKSKHKMGPKATFLVPKTKIQEERQRRVLDALALKRRRPELSLTKAAKESGTTLATIRRYAAGAIETRSGRLDVRSSDRIARDLRFLDPKGQITVRVTNSRDATRVARYNNAVRHLALTGDDSRLKPFVGKALRAGGRQYPFVTDPAVLNKLARAGEVHFLDIYATSHGSI